MESRNLAVPIGVFAVAAIGLAIALNSPHKTEEESTTRPAAVAPITGPTSHPTATTKHH